ncbi:hypothetical protein [Pseudooceanicola nanhaiensis]|uniref:hypothetical protein n=1 Tax=Pseudooceanicola nanhaiensis TaxID=375761 RepID=UPI001CD792B5|nr:hypothetical protein [Pseudooceanicola nanhaiensis]MCA0920221.1 hypothetical protein [Pseudooceanicola nanhaiensis]
MPQSVIGSLRVNLGLDSAQFEQGVRRATASTDGMRTRFAGLARTVAASTAGLGAAVAGMAAITRSAAGAAREIETMSRLSNAQAGVFQRWAAGAKSVGIEQDQLAGILKDVNDRVGEFVQTGGGPMADFFEKIAPKIGMTAQQFSNLSGPEALQLYVSSLEKAGLSQQEMTFYMEAMASESAGLLPLLVQNGAEMDRLGDRAEELGAVMDQSAIAALGRAQQAVDTSGEAWKGLRNTLAVQVAPAMEAAAQASAAIAVALQPLVENLDRLAVIGGTVAAAFGARLAISLGTTFVASAAAAVRQAVALELALGATSTSSALASVSIKGMSAALRTLRGAIISTGIGIVVVGAGELIYQFGRLVSATGGFGTALGLVKDVAVEVWERIGNGADFVYQSIKTMIYNAKAVFVGGLNAMVGAWIDLTWTVADGLNSLFGTNLQGASAEITQSLAAIQTAAEDAAGAAKADAEAAAKAFAAPLESVQALRDAVAKTEEASEDGASAADRLNTSLKGVGDGAGSASKGLKDATKSAKSFDEVLKEAVKTAEEIEEDAAHSVVSGIDSIAGSFGDFLTNGLSDFDGFKDGILGGFKSMIREMTTTAARNEILINMGVTGSAGASGTLSTSGATGSIGGSNGILGSVLGLGGSFVSGASGLVTSLFGAGGGLASAATYLGSVLGAATTSLGAFAAAIGAIAGPLALAIPLISGLFGKTKLLDAGLRVTIDGMDGLVETFKYVKKTALFGLISSKKYSYSPAEAEVADPVLLAIQQVQDGVVAAAGAIGVASSVFDDFATQLIISTKDLEDDEIAAAVQEALTGMADEMADLVLAGHDVMLAGESSSEALSRLSEHLTATAAVFDTLGHSMFEVSIAGADLASSLVQLFGSTDAFNTAASTYFAAFYTEAERIEVYTRQATEALAAFGVALPASRAAYRDLVESLDLSTDSGQELYAVLLQLAGTMDQVLPAAQSFTDIISALVGTTSSVLGDMISEVTSTAREAEQAATAWYRVADGLRDLIREITGSTGTGTGEARMQATWAAMQEAFTAALGGDLGAAQDFAALSSTYLDAAKVQATSLADYKRSESAVLAQANKLAGVSDLQGSIEEAIVDLSEQQLEVLNELNDYLQSSGEITDEDLAAFEGSLTGLQGAIEALQDFSYSDLMAELEAQITLIPTTSLPKDVKDLLKAATDGIMSEIEFAVTAKDLTPDLRFLAVNAASEHMKTVDFVLGEELSPNLMRLALDDVTSLTRTVNMVMGSTLTGKEMRVALAGSSELSRVVNVALASDADEDAIALALGNIGAYSVAITASLDAATSKEVRDIITTDASTFALMIEAAFSDSLSDDARKVLLDQQGQYVVNILGTLSEGLDPQVSALLLEANTDAVRGITIAMAFADSLTEDERTLLLTGSLTTLHTISAVVNPLGITTFDVMFLDQLTSGKKWNARTIGGYLDSRGIKDIGRTFIEELASGQPDVWRSITAMIATGSLSGLALDFLETLSSGDDPVNRIVQAEVLTGGLVGLSLNYLDQLVEGDGEVARAIYAKMNASGIGNWGLNYLAQLFAGAGEITRGIVGQTDSGDIGAWGFNYLAQLFAGAGTTKRGITAAMSSGSIGSWGFDYLGQIFEGIGFTKRGITAAMSSGNIGDWGFNYLFQLFDGDGATKRGITAAMSSGNVAAWGFNYLSQLFDGEAFTKRGITAAMSSGGVQNWGFSYLSQLFSGDGYTKRGVTAAMSTGGVGSWGFSYLSQLFMGTGSVLRGITGKTNSGGIGAWGFNYLNQLFEGSGDTLRGIIGQTSSGRIGAWGLEYLRQLYAGDGDTLRAITGQTSAGAIGAWGFDYLRQLFAGDGSVARGILASIRTGEITGAGYSFLGQIAAGSTTITKIIDGAVDLSGLTGREKTLLDMIAGSVSGKVTLNGTVVFEPSTAFSAWFEDELSRNITAPFTALKAALDELRAAVAADTLQRERSAALTGLQQQLAAVSDARAGVVSQASSIISQIEALEAETGVSLRNGTGDAGLAVSPEGYITYRASHVEYGTGADLTAFSDAFWGEGGLEDQLQALLGQPTQLAQQMETLRQQIRTMGGVPAFAMGGLHAGGLRLVGENGPELEVTGPARYYSAPQTSDLLGNRGVVEELRRLRAELADLKDEQRQLGLSQASDLAKLRKLAVKDDTIGTPPERAA